MAKVATTDKSQRRANLRARVKKGAPPISGSAFVPILERLLVHFNAHGDKDSRGLGEKLASETQEAPSKLRRFSLEDLRRFGEFIDEVGDAWEAADAGA
jgi:hypothetical protein